MEYEKIAAGGIVKCNEKEGVIGAVIKYKGKKCILTVYHLIKVGNCDLGDIIKVWEFNGRIIEIIMEYDLFIAEIYAPSPCFEFSKLDKPEIGPAYALKGGFKNNCNIMTTGKIYHYLSFAPRFIPLHGDSGSPIIQKGMLLGFLLLFFIIMPLELQYLLNHSLIIILNKFASNWA